MAPTRRTPRKAEAATTPPLVTLEPIRLGDRELSVRARLVISLRSVRAILIETRDGLELYQVCDTRLLYQGDPPRFADETQALDYLSERLRPVSSGGRTPIRFRG